MSQTVAGRLSRRVIVSWSALSVCALGLAACIGDDVTANCRVGSIAVGSPSANVVVGQTIQATANFSVQNCSPLPTIAWTSENNAIATVSASGLITGMSVGGPIVIRATVNGNVGTRSITVVAGP